MAAEMSQVSGSDANKAQKSSSLCDNILSLPFELLIDIFDTPELTTADRLQLRFVCHHFNDAAVISLSSAYKELDVLFHECTPLRTYHAWKILSAIKIHARNTSLPKQRLKTVFSRVRKIKAIFHHFDSDDYEEHFGPRVQEGKLPGYKQDLFVFNQSQWGSFMDCFPRLKRHKIELWMNDRPERVEAYEMLKEICRDRPERTKLLEIRVECMLHCREDVELYKSLSNVTRLHLHGKFPAGDIGGILRRSPNLKHLRIYYVDGATSFDEIMSWLPDGKTTRLDRLRIDYPPITNPKALDKIPDLEYLEYKPNELFDRQSDSEEEMWRLLRPRCKELECIIVDRACRSMFDVVFPPKNVITYFGRLFVFGLLDLGSREALDQETAVADAFFREYTPRVTELDRAKLLWVGTVREWVSTQTSPIKEDELPRVLSSVAVWDITRPEKIELSSRTIESFDFTCQWTESWFAKIMGILKHCTAARTISLDVIDHKTKDMTSLEEVEKQVFVDIEQVADFRGHTFGENVKLKVRPIQIMAMEEGSEESGDGRYTHRTYIFHAWRYISEDGAWKFRELGPWDP